MTPEDQIDPEVEVDTTPAPKQTRLETMKAIKEAISNGLILPSDARSIKSQLGISQSTFTRAQPTNAVRKSKRKIQKDSRRKNRCS